MVDTIWLPPGHTRPSWHGMQRPPRPVPSSELLGKLRKLPSRHWQCPSEVAAWKAVVCAGSGHALQFLAPGAGEKVPRGQRRQAVPPSAGWCHPAAQAKHASALAVSMAEPAGQGLQLSIPAGTKELATRRGEVALAAMDAAEEKRRSAAARRRSRAAGVAGSGAGAAALGGLLFA